MKPAPGTSRAVSWWRMTPSRITGLAVAIALFSGWAPQTLAYTSSYATDCQDCHGTAVTCRGCHSHGAQQSTAKNAISISGQLDKASYAPGDTITVTVTGGYAPTGIKTGWLRVVLLDDAMNEIGRGGSSDYPVTLTTTAPSSAGPHAWAVAWYGNAERDITLGYSLGAGTSATLQPGHFTEDQANLNHGWQTVALPAFTVTGSDAGAPDAGPPAASGGGSVTSDAGTSDAGTDGGTSPSTTPSGGCGTGSGGLAALVFLTLHAARRLRRRLDV